MKMLIVIILTLFIVVTLNAIAKACFITPAIVQSVISGGIDK